MKRYKLKERLQRLEEQLEDADSVPQDLYSIKILNTKLKYLEKYKYIAIESKDLEETLLDNIITAIADNDKSFFVKKDEKYLGFITYWLDKTKTIVDGILFFNFSEKDDTNEMLKDTLSVLIKLRSDYDEINFEADIDNEKANKIYKIYCDRHHGYYRDTKYFTVKYTVPGENMIDFGHKIREAFSEEDRFFEIYGL